jgi:anti-sigma factor ChrR (cupin superfamily)
LYNELEKKHPDEGLFERYALGDLLESEVPAFEQHLLICHECQDRMAETDAYVLGMQAAARKIRAEEPRSRSVG